MKWTLWWLQKVISPAYCAQTVCIHFPSISPLALALRRLSALRSVPAVFVEQFNWSPHCLYWQLQVYVQTYLASAARRSSSSLSQGRAVHCTLRPVTPWEPPMESSIAAFLMRRSACELPPTILCSVSDDWLVSWLVSFASCAFWCSECILSLCYCTLSLCYFMFMLGLSPHKNCKNDLDDQTWRELE